MLRPTSLRSGYQWRKEHSTDMVPGYDIEVNTVLFRLCRAGIPNKHSRLKLIVHHLVSLMPVLPGRTANFAAQNAYYESKKDPLDLLRSFCLDTAEGIWGPRLGIALDFFGPSHVPLCADYL